MSRIGKTPIIIPNGTTITINKSDIFVKGPKGEMHLTVPDSVTVSVKNNLCNVISNEESNYSRAIHGLIRAIIANIINGVTVGWTKVLELSGVGYRAAVSGSNLVLTVGFSHPVTVIPPTGITFSVTEGKINVMGVDKQLVGQVAANIRAVKKPEPYKGKGIKYQGEHIRRKAGKSAKAIGGAPAAAK